MLLDEIAAYLTSEDVDVFRDRSYAGADGILALPALEKVREALLANTGEYHGEGCTHDTCRRRRLALEALALLEKP